MPVNDTHQELQFMDYLNPKTERAYRTISSDGTYLLYLPDPNKFPGREVKISNLANKEDAILQFASFIPKIHSGPVMTDVNKIHPMGEDNKYDTIKIVSSFIDGIYVWLISEQNESYFD